MRVYRKDKWLPTYLKKVSTESGLLTALRLIRFIMIKKFFWLLPFISFILGYYTIYYFFSKPACAVPLLIGRSIQDATQILSVSDLNLRILGEKEEAEYKPGTILSQIPSAHTKIKQKQSIYINIACAPKKKLAPQLIGLNEKEITDLSKKNSFSVKIFTLESVYPQGICFAQFPQSQSQLSDNSLVVYISSGITNYRIFPNISGQKVSDFEELIKQYPIKINVTHKKEIDNAHNCKNCHIIKNKPIAGSVIDIAKPLTVYLYVDSEVPDNFLT